MGGLLAPSRGLGLSVVRSTSLGLRLGKKVLGGDTLPVLDQPCLYSEIPCTRMQIVRAAQSGFAEFEVFYELDKALGSSGSGIDIV